MRTYRGGDPVGKGTYWSPRTGRVVEVKDAGVLPGGSDPPFVRIPFLLFLPVGVLLGGMYVFLLPAVSFGAALSVLAKRAFGGVALPARRFLSFGWRPTEAYLAGDGEAGKRGNGRKTEGERGGGRKQFPEK